MPAVITAERPDTPDAELLICGSGSWGGRRPSMADYVMETGAPRGATAAGGG